MSIKTTQSILAIILLAAAAILVLGVLFMWMMPSMMGGMMGEGMMGYHMGRSMSGWMILWTGGPLLLAALLVVLAIVLFRRSP